jgi:TP901 family phage tail tape measure protein
MPDLAELSLRVRLLGIELTNAGLSNFRNKALGASAAANQFNNTSRRMSTTAQGLSKTMSSLTKTITSLAAAFLGLRGIRAAFDAVKNIELGLINVAKTVNFTDQQLEKFERRFKGIASAVSEPIESLLEFSVVAGQLGIRGVQNIANFAETIGKLADATPRLASEEAAIGLARILAITGEGTDNIEKMASAITLLDNETKALADQTLLVATFIAQSTTAFGLSSKQVLSLAGALAALGQRAEISSTALARIFGEIESALSGQTTQLDKFAAVANLTSEEFAKIYSQDKVEGLKVFLQGLGELSERGVTASDVLDGVSVNGLRALRTLGTLAKNTDQLNQSTTLVNREYTNATELQREFERGMTALARTISRLTNAVRLYIKDLATDSGLVGGMKRLVNTATDAIRVLSGVEIRIQRADEAVAGMIQAMRGLISAVGIFLGLSLLSFLSSGIVLFFNLGKTLLVTTGVLLGLVNATKLVDVALKGAASAGALFTSGFGGLAVVSIILAALYTWFLRSSDAANKLSEETIQVHEQMRRLESAVDAVVSAQQSLADAQRDNNSRGQVQAIESQIKALKALENQIRVTEEVRDVSAELEKIRLATVTLAEKKGRIPLKFLVDAEIPISEITNKLQIDDIDIFQNIGVREFGEELKKVEAIYQGLLDAIPKGRGAGTLSKELTEELASLDTEAERIERTLDVFNPQFLKIIDNFDLGTLSLENLRLVAKEAFELFKDLEPNESVDYLSLFSNLTVDKDLAADFVKRFREALQEELEKGKIQDPFEIVTEPDTGRRIEALDLLTQNLRKETELLKLNSDELSLATFAQEALDDARRRGFTITSPAVSKALQNEVDVRAKTIFELAKQEQAVSDLEDSYTSLIDIQDQLNQDSQDLVSTISDFGFSDSAVEIRQSFREINSDVQEAIRLLRESESVDPYGGLKNSSIKIAQLNTFLRITEEQLVKIGQLKQVKLTIDFQTNINKQVEVLQNSFDDFDLTNTERNIESGFRRFEKPIEEYRKSIEIARKQKLLDKSKFTEYEAELDKFSKNIKDSVEDSIDLQRLDAIITEVSSTIGDGLTKAILDPTADLGEQVGRQLSETILRGFVIDPLEDELQGVLRSIASSITGKKFPVKLNLEEEIEGFKKLFDDIAIDTSPLVLASEEASTNLVVAGNSLFKDIVSASEIAASNLSLRGGSANSGDFSLFDPSMVEEPTTNFAEDQATAARLSSSLEGFDAAQIEQAKIQAAIEPQELFQPKTPFTDIDLSGQAASDQAAFDALFAPVDNFTSTLDASTSAIQTNQSAVDGVTSALNATSSAAEQAASGLLESLGPTLPSPVEPGIGVLAPEALDAASAATDLGPITAAATTAVGTLNTGIGTASAAIPAAATSAVSTLSLGISTASLGFSNGATATIPILTSAGAAAGAGIVAGATQAALILGLSKAATAAPTGGATLFAAHGAAFSAGHLIEGFAAGGTTVSRGTASSIINKPTLIPQALIGEGARSEAILPLEKTSGGDLGVLGSIGGVSTILPIDRLADGNMGVRIGGLARGGIINNLDQTAGLNTNNRFLGPTSNLSPRQDNELASSSNGGLNITVVIKEPRTRGGARMAGATIGRKIAEALN